MNFVKRRLIVLVLCLICCKLFIVINKIMPQYILKKLLLKYRPILEYLLLQFLINEFNVLLNFKLEID